MHPLWIVLLPNRKRICRLGDFVQRSGVACYNAFSKFNYEGEIQMNYETAQKRSAKEIFVLLIPFIIYILNLFVFPIIFMLIGLPQTALFIVKSAIDIAILVGTLLLYNKKGIKLFKKVQFKWWFLLLPIAVYVLNMAKNPLLLLIFGEQPVANADAILSMMEANLIYTLVASVIIAPVLEEVMFRGVLMNTIFEKQQWIGYFVSSFLFSLIHTPTNLYSFFNYFIIGLLFGGVMKLTKSLGWSMATHIVNNLLAQILVLISIYVLNAL